MYIDSHSHTKHFSADASMNINELMSSCVEKNVSTIITTEHYDFDYPHPEEPLMYCDMDAYYTEHLNWQKNAPENLEILFGIEFGFQPHLVNYYEELAKKYPFDSIILSNHLYGGIDVYFSKECYKEDKATRVKNYISSLRDMASECNSYNIVAHYDYINRYSPDVNEEVLYSDCPNEFDSLFEVLISKEKSLEINTASIAKRISNNAVNTMPDPRIIERYISMGGKFITLGSDAHKPEAIAQNFDIATEYLKSFGVKELCYFKNRKPNFYSI